MINKITSAKSAKRSVRYSQFPSETQKFPTGRILPGWEPMIKSLSNNIHLGSGKVDVRLDRVGCLSSSVYTLHSRRYSQRLACIVTRGGQRLIDRCRSGATRVVHLEMRGLDKSMPRFYRPTWSLETCPSEDCHVFYSTILTKPKVGALRVTCLHRFLAVFERPFVDRFALCYQSVICSVCL